MFRRAALVSPTRTPVGRFGGSLKTMSASSLATVVVEELVARSGIDPERIDKVVVGQSYSNSEAPASDGR